MKNVQNTLVILILTLSVISCKKEIENKALSSSSVSTSAMLITNFPNNINGRLVFQDWMAYHNYIYEVEQELNEPYITDEDSSLYHIEINDLGNFYSLRQDMMISNGLATPTDWIDTNAEFTEVEIENMFSCDFIVDDIVKSILNEYYEFQIGDSVFIVVNSKFTLGVHKNDVTSINNIRNIEKCDQELLLSSLSPNISITHNDYPEGSGETNKCGDFTNEAGQQLKMGSLECPVDCDQFSMKFFTDLKYISGTSTVGGTVINEWSRYGPIYNMTIDFGDGSPISTITNTGISHTFPSAQPYTIIYTIQFEDSPDDAIQNISTATCTTVVIINDAPPCSTKEATYQDSKKNDDEDWSMSYKLRLKNGKYRKSLVGWTRAWKKKSNGKWKNRRTTITTNVDGTFRHIGACESIAHQPSKHKNKCRRKLTSRASKFDNNSFHGPKVQRKALQKLHWAVADQDCYSYHSLDNRGISKTVYLNLCD